MDILNSQQRILPFVQYYVLPYFLKYSAAAHKQRNRPLIGKCSEALLDEADAWMMHNLILNVMPNLAVKVPNAPTLKEDIYAEQVFRFFVL